MDSVVKKPSANKVIAIDAPINYNIPVSFVISLRTAPPMVRHICALNKSVKFMYMSQWHRQYVRFFIHVYQWIRKVLNSALKAPCPVEPPVSTKRQVRLFERAT